MALPDYFGQMFTAVYGALYKRTVTTDKLILPGNFPDMSDPNFQTFKNLIKPSDTPELIMVQGGFLLQPHGLDNTQVANFSQSYPIVVTCQDLTTIQVNPLKLSIMVAAYQAGTSVGPGQNEDDFGLPYIRTYTITNGADDALSDSLFKRGTLRYISLFTINLYGYIERAALASA